MAIARELRTLSPIHDIRIGIGEHNDTKTITTQLLQGIQLIERKLFHIAQPTMPNLIEGKFATTHLAQLSAKFLLSYLAFFQIAKEALLAIGVEYAVYISDS